MGYVLSPTGSPMVTKPVDVRNASTGALVVSGQTNNDGRWEFDLADEAQAYRVEIGAGAGSPQKVTQAPASTEHEYIFVRYGATFKAAVSLPPGTSIGGITIDPGAPPGTGALDPRYYEKAVADAKFVDIAGDTMTGALTIDMAGAALNLRTPAAPADNRRLRMNMGDADGRLRISALNDAGAGGTAYIDLTRTGNNLTALYLVGLPIISNVKTNLFGTNGGAAATTGVAYADANILLYGDGANNWAGFGSDAGGNVWLRTGVSGTPLPALYVGASTGEIVAQRGPVYATKGLFVYHPTIVTQGVIYFGNTAAHYLNWDGANAFNLSDGLAINAPVSVALNLVDGSVGFSTILMRNSTNAAFQWRHGVQGSSGSVSPANSIVWYNDTYGAHMYMQPDGRIAMGAPPPAGTSAQLDIRTIHPTVPTLRVTGHASISSTIPFVRFDRSTGVPVLGACHLGLVSDLCFDVTSFNTPLRALAVYFSNGTFAGYIPLYRSYN